MNKSVAVFFCLLLMMTASSATTAAGQPDDAQTRIAPAPPAQAIPLVVIYTLSTCPHCREAKEFFTSNNIPFINREVDTDSQHMAELMQIYDRMNVPDQKRGVPLIVIGDEIRLQGFNKDKVREALKKYQLK
jgi:glutaredoxin 3